ncbi:Cytochrome P450 2W1 [Lemmus lemmus]
MFGEANVLACTLDMIMAGTETTAATLQWAVFLMVKHPHVQVQEELDRVLGPGQLPRPEDQRALPYTSAVLHETQRYITLLPHVPRCTTADIQLGGYLLPKVRSYLLLCSDGVDRGHSHLSRWWRWEAGTPLGGALPLPLPPSRSDPSPP